MSTYCIVTSLWTANVLVDDDGVVVNADEIIAIWALGYDWKHVRRYLEQYGFVIETGGH